MRLSELERGPLKMKDRQESRLRTMRMEEMLAVRIVLEEDERMERLEEATMSKKLWILSEKKKQIDKLVVEIKELELIDVMENQEGMSDEDDMDKPGMRGPRSRFLHVDVLSDLQVSPTQI